MRLLNVVAWATFLGIGPVVWASGVWLFLRSPFSRPRKIGWTLFLIFVGIGIGCLLPLPAIRNRFLVLLVGLPLLAIIDVKLAKSNRRLSFWLRACFFEICTVFGIAAITRLALERISGAP